MVAGMDVLVQTFLDIIQPNDFPSNLIVKLEKSVREGLPNEASTRADLINDALKYELGFLVCLAIGLLYIVLMPLIGICLARQNTSRPGYAAPLYWGAYITVMAVILVGNVYLYISNAAIKRYVDDSTKVINGTLYNLHNYADGLLGSIEQGVSASIGMLEEKLNDIGPELGENIKKLLVAGLRLEEICGHAEDMSNLNMIIALNNFNSNVTMLENLTEDLTSLITVSKELHTNLSHFNISVHGKGIGPSLTANLVNIRVEYLDKISGNIKIVTDGVDQTDIKAQILNVTKDPLYHVSKTVNVTFGIMKNDTICITPVVEKVGYITWAVGVALCCVLVLVLVRNILGLLVGSVGVGPVVSFLLCSMLMAVVMPLFLLGGHSYTLLCKPWGNGELFRSFDNHKDLGKMLGLISSDSSSSSNLKLADVYNDCANGTSLWDTLHLEKLLNLTEMFKVPKVLERSKFLGALNDLKDITFLSDSDKKNIDILIRNTKEIDFARFEGLSGTHITPDINLTLKALNHSANLLKSQVVTFNNTVGRLLNTAAIAKSFLKNSGTPIGNIFDVYLADFPVELTAEFTIRIKKVNCMTLAKEVDNAKSFICGNMVTSLNTFWFSLGMCLIFFIPSIVLSIKLAKYYRTKEPPSVQDLGRSAASLQRDQLKLMRKKAMDQFGHLKPTGPFVETDDYEYVYVKTT